MKLRVTGGLQTYTSTKRFCEYFHDMKGEKETMKDYAEDLLKNAMSNGTDKMSLSQQQKVFPNPFNSIYLIPELEPLSTIECNLKMWVYSQKLKLSFKTPMHPKYNLMEGGLWNL